VVNVIPMDGPFGAFVTAAYEALAPDFKDRIGDLEVIHDPDGGKVAFEEEVRGGGQHDCGRTVRLTDK
jgi:hypothetical protein